MTRTLGLLSAVLIVLVAVGCAAPSSPKMLTDISGALQGKLDAMNAGLVETAKTAGREGLDSVKTREALAAFYDAHPYIVDCCTIAPPGRLVAVAPKEYRSFEGADVSSQEQVKKVLAKGNPEMSGVFKAVEGFPGIDIEQPVLARDGKVVGSVSAFLRPDEFIPKVARVIVPEGSQYYFWVMQPDGMMLYDRDPTQVGINLLKDPLYAPYPDVQTTGRRIAGESSGDGTYRFLSLDRKAEHVKKCWWTTVSLHGRQWRVVLATDVE